MGHAETIQLNGKGNGAMSAWQSMAYPTDKKAMYELLLAQLQALTDGERDWLPNLANASALIFQALETINWAGFYLMKDGMLVLGPFQGNPACIRIPVGRGVCGTAAEMLKTQLVMDVHQFPGHIACDAASRSEVVVPLMKGEKLLGVLDIDSPIEARFDQADAEGLQLLCAHLADVCDWAV